MPKIKPETLLKADAFTLVVRAEKDGNIRLTCASWEDARVLLRDQALLLRWENGQVVATRISAPAPIGDVAAQIVTALEKEGFDVDRDRADATRLAMKRGIDQNALPSASDTIREVIKENFCAVEQPGSSSGP